MTLARRSDGRYTKINIYRHQDDGRFSSDDASRFVEWSGILFTMLHKHFCVERPSADKSTSAYADALQRHAPLSAREAEVCAEIAVGRTSEAIALKLQISINTVLTYRKRAYSRLRISSQNELTRLVHDVAVLDGVAA
jgi:DNA-binding CsgD family transcriptional regulator